MADPEIEYAHMGWRDTPKRQANRAALQRHIEAIWDEYLATPRTPVLGCGLPLAPRYANGRPCSFVRPESIGGEEITNRGGQTDR